MSEADARQQSRRGLSGRLGRVSLMLTGLGWLAAAPAAVAATPSKPTVPAGFTIIKLAAAPAGATNCDDLTSLEGHLFTGCQNKALSNGGGGNSTLLEFGLDGSLVKTWSLKDKIDGIGADPLHHRVIITLNEDANSHLATLTPSSGQIANYTYSPDPRGASAPVALHTGGGTDNVSVDSAGHILTTGSHAGTKTGTAVFKVALSASSSASGTGTATLSPTFLDNATATNGNTGSGTLNLSLGDVDSGAIVPPGSPRFAGSYVIDDQTALELVFANNVFNGTGLTVLKTPFGLDDIKWATSDAGTMYIVDKGPAPGNQSPALGKSALYKVTGPFTKDTVFASNDGVGDQIVKVNLSTGALTPFVRGLNTTKGLIYVDPSGSEAQLPLSGAAAATRAASPKPTSASASTKKSSGSSNTALIVVIIIVALAVLAGGGYALSRRRQSS